MYDDHAGRTNKVTLKKAFASSSNIGISTAVFDNYRKKPANFIAHLKNLGLDQPTGIEILGENKPFVNHPKSGKWSNMALPWLSIGYENFLSPIQVLVAYNAIVNEGIHVTPTLVTAIGTTMGNIKQVEKKKNHR